MRSELLVKYRPLLLAGAAVVVLPLLMSMFGLTLDLACVIVIFSLAAIGLNLLIGYTGLVSFGHGVWFGIGAYAAALAQKYWFPDQVIVPILFSIVVVACTAALLGLIILRRRGVYFALMTLALSALFYTVAFRWTALTGGEDGLGGLHRGSIGPFKLANEVNYYIFSAAICLVLLYFMIRVLNSPFGHVLQAIRENQARAEFQGYPINRYKLVAFVISAVVTGIAGALSGFQHYIVSADAISVPFSGDLMAMVVVGGMHSLLGPAVGVVFFIIFRELLSIYTDNWMLWFGLVFVAFVMFSPEGIVGIWKKISKRLRPAPELSSAMSRRKIHDGLPLPGFLTPPAASGPVLEVDGINMFFGGFHAVKDVRLTVEGGQIHALIGPNGAGKTTTFNLISGGYAPTSGSIKLHGEPIQGLDPARIASAGLGRSFQITSLFEGLAIEENLRLSLQAKHPARFNIWKDARSYSEINAQTAELMKFLGLEGIEDVMAGDLSYGGQRLVDLGIALATKPKVLLLDEPLAGLAAAERERVSRLVQRMADNIPVLIVEHDLDRVLSLSHKVTVMNQGGVLMVGSPDQVRCDKHVQEIYTGTGTPAVVGRAATGLENAALRLQVRDLNTFYGKSHILNDAALEVREGEIVALLGRNGAGKSTLLKSLAGLVPARSGSILFEGTQLAGMSAPDIARLGIGYVPQGRGVFAGMSVADNLALGRLARSTDGSNGTVWSEEHIFEMFPRLKERYKTAADYLSGGEQQMLAVARALSGGVKLLLLDEPFEGLAPAIVEDLFRVFDRLRVDVPIMIVEHNLDLVLALADRVFALERGAVFHEGPARPLLENINYRKEILWL